MTPLHKIRIRTIFISILFISAFAAFLTCSSSGTKSVGKAVISSDGGSIVSEDGKLTLTIPAGALSGDVEITITQNEDGSYTLEPPITFNLPVAFSFSMDNQGIEDAINESGATDADGNPLDPAKASGLTIVFLDDEILDNVTTERDADGNLNVTGELTHFSTIILKSTFMVTTFDRLVNKTPVVGETFFWKATATGFRFPQKLSVKNKDTKEEEEYIVVNMIMDFFVAFHPVNRETIARLSDEKTLKGKSMIGNPAPKDETQVTYKCLEPDTAIFLAAYFYTITLGQFGKEPKTITGISRFDTIEFCSSFAEPTPTPIPTIVGPSPSPSPSPTPTVTPVPTATPAMVSALKLDFATGSLSSGIYVPMSCISGGSVGDSSEPNCNCDHQHGTISISGVGSDFSDPDSTNCGHGCIVTVTEDLLGHTCD